jgi:hypothetical protein
MGLFGRLRIYLNLSNGPFGWRSQKPKNGTHISVGRSLEELKDGEEDGRVAQW